MGQAGMLDNFLGHRSPLTMGTLKVVPKRMMSLLKGIPTGFILQVTSPHQKTLVLCSIRPLMKMDYLISTTYSWTTSGSMDSKRSSRRSSKKSHQRGTVVAHFPMSDTWPQSLAYL